MSLIYHVSNNVKIYNISGLKEHQLQDWLEKRYAKKLKKDTSWRQKVQLLQDITFPESALRLSYTLSQDYIIASGIYKPQYRVYDLKSSTILFERHLDAEPIAQCVLSEDWRKSIFLTSNRTLTFQGSSGPWYSIKIPKMGRNLTYDEHTCDLIIPSSGSEVYRFNLDRGHFMIPLQTLPPENIDGFGINVVKVNKSNGLYGMGGDSGWMEFWDRRDKSRICAFKIGSKCRELDCSFISDLSFLPGDLCWAAGNSHGKVGIFDLRNNNQPLTILDHFSDSKISKIDWHQPSQSLISSDKKSIKIWKDPREINNRNLWTTIESTDDINDFLLDSNSGLIMTACEGGAIDTYFIPTLGPAPRWCSFLENLTEEMEESGQNDIYGNYKFLTRSEIASLGIEHLMSSAVLKPYMHGFFIDVRLYEKIKTMTKSFEYESWVNEKVKRKFEELHQTRVKKSTSLENKNIQIDKRFEAILNDQDYELTR